MDLKQEKTVQNLINSGFTSKESVVIFVLYKHGLMTALEICKRTKIAKVSVLFILKKLYTDGLVERMRRDNTFVFSARTPSVLSQRLEADSQTLSRKKDLLNSAINELQILQDYEANHSFQYYNDIDHVKRLRAGLVDMLNLGSSLIKKSKQDIEYFENDEYIYLISLKKQFAIKIAPKEDFLKLLEICKLYS